MYNVGLPGATGLMVKEEEHRIHRGALAAVFKPRLTSDIPTLIQERVEQLLHRISCTERRKTVNVSDAFRSLSRDVMMTIFLGENEDLLSTPDLGHSVLKQYRALFQLAAWHRQFPFLGPLVKCVPDCVTKFIVPHLSSERVCWVL